MKQQTKEFKHEEIVECKLCNKDIDTTVDKWNALIDYESKTQIAIGYYHRSCFNDLINEKVKVIKDKFEQRLGGFAKKMFGRLGINPQTFQMNPQGY